MIELDNVGKKYPLLDHHYCFWALKDVSFKVEKGEAIGILGRNGSGKTTLLSIIAGVLSPTEGTVSIKGKVLGLFNLGVGFQDELTGRENIFLNGAILGASREEIDSKFRAIVDFSELGDFIDMPLGSYSQGMKLRLGFSIIANLDFDVLVIDEVLAVGDIMFQNKCFERLMDFKTKKKTLIMTSQNVDLIERICDRGILLEHGRILFCGDVLAAKSRYKELLNKTTFSIGPCNDGLINDTKKWADDVSMWGLKLGAKDLTIDSVELINRFGFRCKSIRTGEPLKIRVRFTAKDDIKEPHFGVAIFRKDGVYCYGPNTDFDGLYINTIKKGSGVFELLYKKVLLAPGEYRLSVALWDKNEVLPFDYHNGCYALIVDGINNSGELLKMPFKVRVGLFNPKINLPLSDIGRDIQGLKDCAVEIRLLDKNKKENKTFMTNEPCEIILQLNEPAINKKWNCVWLGIYREDDVYCQGITAGIISDKINIYFPELKLLPGPYKISLGLWDNFSRRFLMFRHGFYDFRMVWNKKDHGTIYMDHKWRRLL